MMDTLWSLLKWMLLIVAVSLVAGAVAAGIVYALSILVPGLASLGSCPA